MRFNTKLQRFIKFVKFILISNRVYILKTSLQQRFAHAKRQPSPLFRFISRFFTIE